MENPLTMRRPLRVRLLRRRGDGTFKIMNLDDAPRKLLVRAGGAPEISVTIDPVHERLKVVHLPPTGRLRVSWTWVLQSKEAIMYRTDGVPRAIISWVFERSSAELRLPEGRYEVGRARKIKGRCEFVGKTEVVDLHAGSDIRLGIDGSSSPGQKPQPVQPTPQNPWDASHPGETF